MIMVRTVCLRSHVCFAHLFTCIVLLPGVLSFRGCVSRAGIIHRDLKPGNILLSNITAAGGGRGQGGGGGAGLELATLPSITSPALVTTNPVSSTSSVGTARGPFTLDANVNPVQHGTNTNTNTNTNVPHHHQQQQLHQQHGSGSREEVQDILEYISRMLEHLRKYGEKSNEPWPKCGR